MEVNDQELAQIEDKSTIEGLPRTSSEPEHHSASEESKNSTVSITGSLVEEHFQNERRYCSDTYYMPNDEAEQTRLAVAHQAYLLALDGQLSLGLIPRSAKRILDVGTGTGDWAIAVAERFPNAEIIATDITNAFQPPRAPCNVFFELDNAENEWAYDEPFDFIHMRNLSGAFSSWSAIYAEVSKNLKRGGSFEVADCGWIQFKEDVPNPNSSIFKSAVRSAADRSGRPLDLDHLKKPMFEDAGLSVVKSRTFDIPLGTYDPHPQKKAAGKMAMIAALEGLEAKSLRLLTKHLGWKEEDVRSLCGKVQEEVMSPDARAFMPVHFVVARKLMG